MDEGVAITVHCRPWVTEQAAEAVAAAIAGIPAVATARLEDCSERGRCPCGCGD